VRCVLQKHVTKSTVEILLSLEDVAKFIFDGGKRAKDKEFCTLYCSKEFHYANLKEFGKISSKQNATANYNNYLVLQSSEVFD
jgi:hypothetical protein